MLRRKSGLLVLATVIGWASSLSGDDKPAAITDPAQADADFAVQGEYTGELRRGDEVRKLGVQVIALGGGKFHSVGYTGGLPGDGWNLADKAEGEGETKDGVTKLTGEKGSAVIERDVMTIIDKEGNNAGKLQKVIRKSPTEGLKAPEGAVVLFDGTTAERFDKGRLTDDRLLIQGATSKQLFGNCTLHLEFRLPFVPAARGQGRGNSGCYLQGRYEVQILDSFGLAGKNNECGGIYEIRDPKLNMCFPPLLWQTYDIDYTAAKYDRDAKKIKNAVISVRHNGVTVQENVELPRSTRSAPVIEGPEPGPLYLQDHSNPVRFRNIWLVEK